MDASQAGLGTVLFQQQEGHKRVICYASRGLSRSEKHYSAFKLEFLALKRAITEKFHDYLYGNNFTVYTDVYTLDVYTHHCKIGRNRTPLAGILKKLQL